jgi:UDP-N-acetylglucosamine 2-epimerase (non-hydrolysing)
MKKKKILLAFGTRPEAIKMAPLCKAIQKEKDFFKLKICVTAQHREMLDQVLSIFNIIPNIDLNIMKKDQDLFDVTIKILESMKNVLLDEKPDLVLVHGDTSTCFVTSLAAFYLKIPVGHVEAGLRTHDFEAPYPEEFNRQITGKLAKLHFTPTHSTKKNLLNERINSNDIFVTGNTVIDSLKIIEKRIKSGGETKDQLSKLFGEILDFDLLSSKYVLITGHRRENFGSGFQNICDSISHLSKKYPDIKFIYPVHLNPNVKNPVNKLLKDLKNVYLIEPLEYIPFIYLMMNCFFIMTDSGGIQEEAPSLGKPVLVMRDLTERPEAVSAGTVLIVGSQKKKIISKASELIDNESLYTKMAIAKNPYGNGNSSKKIVEAIKNYYER